MCLCVCVWDSVECLRRRTRTSLTCALLVSPCLSLSAHSFTNLNSDSDSDLQHRPSSALASAAVPSPPALTLSLFSCMHSLASPLFHKVVFMHSHKHFYFNDFYYCAHSLLFMRPRGSEQAPSALPCPLCLLHFVSLCILISPTLSARQVCQLQSSL